ncbi:MAG: sigma-70 family RNA polymerase sigma factor [Acidobacteria bacterium]|nr:sigma-70 family RNA polymerase sigma factor [Acidobacteriota bacterium]
MLLQAAQIAELELHRTALTGHCYRMLGSVTDADDAVQETMLRACRAIDNFDGRSSLHTWLHRIATNVCLDELQDRKRRARPIEEGPAGTVHDELIRLPANHWVEPVPDAAVLPKGANPEQLALHRESIRLAFVATLQHLPPKQRAALLLMEVLGWAASDVAATLDLTVAAVNSALQRARATMASIRESTTMPAENTDAELARQFADAFERYDLDALIALMHRDVTLSMPPYALWLRGHDAVRAWLTGRGCGCRGSRVIPTAANGVRAFAQYRPDPGGGHTAWALIVLETAGDKITAWNAFLETEKWFPRFGLPRTLGE